MSQQLITAQPAGELSFAYGKVGIKNQLLSAEEVSNHAEQLGLHTRLLTIDNTADCGDERLTLSLANGESDPSVLRGRIVPQIFGGIGLGTAKALVAANALIVKDAKTFWDAYEKTNEALAEIRQLDAGHEGCGASASVQKSVANALPYETVVSTIGGFLPAYEDLSQLVTHNAQIKNRRLQDGFYSDWDPQKHIDFLTSKVPQNFSYLKVDHEDHETHGHHGSSLYVVRQPGYGFAKNSFIEDTGQEAFSVTLHKILDISSKLGVSPVERRRIAVAFLDDTLHVGAGIVAPTMPVFVEA